MFIGVTDIIGAEATDVSPSDLPSRAPAMGSMGKSPVSPATPQCSHEPVAPPGCFPWLTEHYEGPLARPGWLLWPHGRLPEQVTWAQGYPTSPAEIFAQPHCSSPFASLPCLSPFPDVRCVLRCEGSLCLSPHPISFLLPALFLQ